MKEEILQKEPVLKTYSIWVICDRCDYERHYVVQKLNSVQVDQVYGPKCVANKSTCNGVNRIYKVVRQ